MEIKNIPIPIGAGYQVSVGRGLLDDCGSLLRQKLGPCRAAVVTDTNVSKLYLARTLASLSATGFQPCSWVFPAGEQSKAMTTLAALLEFLADNRLTRQDCLIALGGGVTGDLVGFAAGVYLRGVPFVQLPTTLLAAVDSSVGGKTAVNLRAGKNLAGLFKQPAAVLCDTDCLRTLSRSTLADGLAEAVKTGVLAGESLFSLVAQGWQEERESAVIAGCVVFKGSIVREDEQELGRRRLLNLGHTVGHGVEKCSDYRISHGQAVAMGLAMITRAARKRGYCPPAVAERIIAALTAGGLPIHAPFSPKELAEAALADKKRAGDTITLVLPQAIGHCVLEQISIAELEAWIRSGMED